MTPLTVIEKRRHPRLQKKFVLRVSQGGEETEPTQWTLVTSKNISAGGVFFTYDRPLEAGTSLTFSIHFPGKTIQCSGTVRRISPTPLKPLVNVAAVLDGLVGFDREFIEQYAA